jgi:hypothetical protein
MVTRLGNMLSGNSLLPIGEWNAHFTTLSVFSRTGWVSRQLTPKELAVSFDLPVALHKEWFSASKDLLFLNATPSSKILMSISEAISSSLAMVVQDLADTAVMEDFGELPASLPPGSVTQAGWGLDEGCQSRQC